MAKDASMRVLDKRPPSEVVHKEIEQEEKGPAPACTHTERAGIVQARRKCCFTPAQLGPMRTSTQAQGTTQN